MATQGGLRYVGASNVTNTASVRAGAAYVFDSTTSNNPPATQIITSSDPSVPSAPPITVELQASDPDGDSLTTYYSLDNGNTWTTYLLPLQVTSPGTTVILFYSQDSNALAEIQHLGFVQVLTNLPPVTILAASDGLNGPSSGSVSVTLGVTDPENDPFTTYVMHRRPSRYSHERVHAQHCRDTPDRVLV